MDRARHKQFLLESLAPKHLWGGTILYYAIVTLLGFTIALGLGTQAGKAHFVLAGGGLVLLGAGGLLWMRSGRAAMAVQCLGSMCLPLAIVMDGKDPLLARTATWLLIAFCVLVPVGIWRVRQILK